jgi:hypothetical protein
MRKVAPDEFFPLLGFLNENGHTPFIVAGQAVNLWARHYAAWDAEFAAFISQNGRLIAGSLQLLLRLPHKFTGWPSSGPFTLFLVQPIY